ncbi:TlpA disulfide reductase family protein [Plantactinospora sp. B24E8]|uniref:TlpA family protein disulfide reductase n=1 Tax=Plantactinospora sp. B24E8 TaxID=3153567 RepID=UPI00325CED01
MSRRLGTRTGTSRIRTASSRLGVRTVSGRPARTGPQLRHVRHSALGGLLLGVLLLATACTGSSDPAEGRRPGATDQGGTTTAFADCATLSTPLTGASAGTAPAGTPTPGGSGTPTGTATPGGTTVRPLPRLSLPCLVGESTVEVGALRGPAVINLWASWCPPCLKELPVFQRFADQAGGAVRVIGVNSGDDRDAAQSLGADFGLRFPSLFDRDKRLLRHAKRPLVPVTFFVDAEGRIRHEDQTGALDYAELTELVREHLGVTVRP